MSDIQEVILVGGSTRILAIQQIVKQLSGKNPNMTVNPDELSVRCETLGVLKYLSSDIL